MNQHRAGDSGPKTLVMILAGGKGKRLYPLTRYRTKAAVPFLGAYRLIDFALSNCLHSRLRNVQLLTQHKSDSLNDHIRHGWNVFHPELEGYIKTVPPQQRLSRQWYRGTADAVYQNLYMLEREKPDLVLVLSGDQVYRMDYRPMIENHVARGADLTVACVPRSPRHATSLGTLKTADEGRVTDFHEKPGRARLAEQYPDDSVPCSAGIYLFRTNVLVERLIEDIKCRRTYDFGSGILPHMVKRGDHVDAYDLADHEDEGYWRDVGTVKAYWKAQMDFLHADMPFDPADRDWPIRCRPEAPTPSRLLTGPADAEPAVRDSMLCAGAVVRGADISGSVIGPGAHIESGTVIRDSIIMQDVVIGPGCHITEAIIDSANHLPPSTRIGPGGTGGWGMTRGGVAVVPQRISGPQNSGSL